jgi:hypothetical protein
MTSSSSFSDDSISLSTRLEWYKIRDTFFGQNLVVQNIPLAIVMASSCDHPDARWLSEACAGKAVETVEDAKRVFSALGQNDARAACFMWMLGDQEDSTALRRSAELGFAFAQGWMARRVSGDEKFKFAQLAAAQGEREGFFWLGVGFSHGQGCKKDLEKGKENLFLASELGHVMGMHWLGSLLDKFDPQRWRLWGRAVALGDRVFLSKFVKQVDLFNSGSGSAAVMFAIGEALQGCVNEEKRTIFNSERKFDVYIDPAKQAIAFFEFQIKACRKAVDAWTIVGKRFGVVKDIRVLIAQLIWGARAEALFKK